MGKKFETENGKWDLEECEKELKKIKVHIQEIISVYVAKNNYVFGRIA